MKCILVLLLRANYSFLKHFSASTSKAVREYSSWPKTEKSVLPLDPPPPFPLPPPVSPSAPTAPPFPPTSPLPVPSPLLFTSSSLCLCRLLPLSLLLSLFLYHRLSSLVISSPFTLFIFVTHDCCLHSSASVTAEDDDDEEEELDPLCLSSGVTGSSGDSCTADLPGSPATDSSGSSYSSTNSAKGLLEPPTKPEEQTK